ncbi:MAG: zinc ribbon domain-containing protein [Nocardioidaceae bacterium]|nr:zinc ribbon domain-containing protein [Nocardioidaceae bacterium]MCL2612023.1 zinc ribbon domain-containing protein [Nocardioidaceae bacterium]
MILIWGFKSYVAVLATFTMVCRSCQNPAAHRLYRITRKFTLFFIPLFPVSRKHVMDCTFCGVRTAVTKDDAESMVAHASGQAPTAPATPAAPPAPPTPGPLQPPA